MKYSLRSLMTVAILAPPLMAVAMVCLTRFVAKLLPRHEAPALASKTAPPALPFIAGSNEAMTAFFKEVKNEGSSEYGLEALTNCCFVEGSPAAPYMALFLKADRICAPDDVPSGVQYEFWSSEEHNPRIHGGALVRVVATGDPLTIADAKYEHISIAP